MIILSKTCVPAAVFKLEVNIPTKLKIFQQKVP